MHCGPIRYRDNPKKQARERPFEHYIVPRFTSLRIPLDIDEQKISIQQLYTEIMQSDFRNQQIIDDVLNNYHQGRNCIVLTLRTAHVESLAKKLKKKVPILIVTRPKEDFKPKDHDTIQRALDLLTDNGTSVVFKSNTHQKFAVMDQKVVWYGSINLLSYGSAQESIMRIESSNIANKLVKGIGSII